MRLLSSALLLFLGCSLVFPSCLSASSVCEYAECKETAAEILSNLNEKIDPCHNFYRYSCEGRFRNLLSLAKVENELNRRLTSNLYADENLKNHGSKAIREAKKVYDDCVKRGTGPCNLRARETCEFAFVRVYMDKYFPVAERNAARRLISSIKTASLSGIINKIEWIDPQTKEHVLNNLTQVQLNVGYPEWLTDDRELDMECQGFEHDRWPMNTLEVNALFQNLPTGGKISKCFLTNFMKSRSLKYL